MCFVKEAVTQANFLITEIVSGCANGVDELGELYADEISVPIKRFKPNWSIGKHAGFIRNVQMANYADGLIAIWDGESRGTKHMIEEMKKRNKKIYVYLKK